MTKETNPCESCRAVCCGPNISIPLTGEEKDLLLSSGTMLVLEPGKDKREGFKSYRMHSSCGFLIVENGFIKCELKAKEDPRRPKCCEEYEAGAGNDLCGLLRESRGIYTPWDVPKLGFY